MYPPVYANVVETIVLDDIFNTTTTTTTEYVYEWKKSAGKAFESIRKNSSVLSLALLSLKASTRDETRTRTTSFDTTHTHTTHNEKELKREFRDT